MAGRGRTERTDIAVAMRENDRARGIVQPFNLSHTSKLPPARDYEGRIYYIGGVTKRLYMSDGSTWRQITIV